MASITSREINISSPTWSRIRRWRYRLRRWPLFSVIVLALLIIAGTVGPTLDPFPAQYGNLLQRHEAPSFLGGANGHLLGTDGLGRDVLSRIISGARVSLILASVTILIAGTTGTALGLVSGFLGGWTDEILMRLVDAANSIPVILIALVLAEIAGPSFGLLLGVLALGQWPRFARQVRAEVLKLKELDYVSLARIADASVVRILIKHILPGVMPTIIVVATAQVGSVILAEASLSFLGVGVPPPTPSWGGMIAEGRLYITVAWWASAFPGLAIALTVLALVFLGDWLRDRLDPMLRQL